MWQKTKHVEGVMNYSITLPLLDLGLTMKGVHCISSSCWIPHKYAPCFCFSASNAIT